MISSPLTFYVVPMEPQHAAEICEWSYKPPYNIYGWMSWEQMQALGVEFGDPQLRSEQYVSVVNGQGICAASPSSFRWRGSPAWCRNAARAVRPWNGASVHEGYCAGSTGAIPGA